jgi:beta-galactosidase
MEHCIRALWRTLIGDTNMLLAIFRSLWSSYRLLVVLTFAWAVSPAAFGAAPARSVVPLNDGWHFALQPTGSGFEAPAFDDSSWEVVAVPHTWNAFDAQDGGDRYVRGDGWYRRTIPWSAALTGKRVYLQVDAANRVAEVWLNGKRLGLHRGGYARFRFDITDVLAKVGANVLAVRVNNEGNDIIPQGGDFSAFGGLYRPVSLLVVPKLHIAVRDYASAGVYLTQRQVSAESAEVVARVLVENDAAPLAPTVVRTTVRDPMGKVVASGRSLVKLKSPASAETTHTLRITKPHLWNGLGDPYLYEATVELLQGARVIDSVTQPLGLRSFSVDPEKGLTLNGRPLRLYGVNRHQDSKDHGYALTEAQHDLDFSLIRELGANTVRHAHYQHSDYEYGLCDRFGIVAWAEVVFVGPPVDSEDFAQNAEEQLRELIRQSYNHPSIFFWGIGNETANEKREAADKVLKRLAAVARAEDPTRLTTYASHHREDDPRNFNTQVLGYNKYFGWYGSSYDDFATFLDGFHAKYPQVSLGISEYGAGASIYQHEEHPPIRARTQAKGPWHPEQWQRDYHEHSWQTIEQRPYLWGSYIWNMFDFASDFRLEGDTAGRNDKGLVTADRLTRKDAFYWYKAHWNPEPLVYITSRRHNLRLEPATEIRIYSSCDAVEVWLNGVSLGTRSVEDRRVVWDSVQLVPGPNRIYAEGRVSGKTVVTDSCSWTLAEGTPYRPADPQPPAAK